MARVTKMSGAGNDFLVLGDEEARGHADDPGWIRRICCRRLSVGGDGVLIVEPLERDELRVEFRNPDGAAAFCGNGTRCAARYARLRGWAGPSMRLATCIGEVPAEVRGSLVRLTLPAPRDRGLRSVEVDGEQLRGRWIDAGVPHFVVSVAALHAAPLERWGPLVRQHADFAPEGVNLDLMQLEADSSVRLRTWERGVEGETLACGSGAVAAALAARLEGCAEELTVLPASGIAIEVDLPGDPGQPTLARMTGDARVIFEGRLGEDAVSGFEVR
jgi:diaminopimelate epimerase